MSKVHPKTIGVAPPPDGAWLKTEQAAHERWTRLISAHPKAAALMHVIIGNMGRHNALVASIPNLQRMMGCSRNTVLRAVNVLRNENWIEVRQLGGVGTTNAYIVNDRIAWSGVRNGIRYSLFSAAVLVSDDEQPDKTEIGTQPPLKRIPTLHPAAAQQSTGPGIPPLSQPSPVGPEPIYHTQSTISINHDATGHGENAEIARSMLFDPIGEFH